MEAGRELDAPVFVCWCGKKRHDREGTLLLWLHPRAHSLHELCRQHGQHWEPTSAKLAASSSE